LNASECRIAHQAPHIDEARAHRVIQRGAGFRADQFDEALIVEANGATPGASTTMESD
jgi:hypothetical protein